MKCPIWIGGEKEMPPLVWVILCYLAFPNILFWIFFLPSGFGIVLAILIVYCLLILRPDSFRGGFSTCFPLLIVSGLILILVGFPHGAFPWDWIKHLAIFNVVAENKWPVSIELNGGVFYLRYYVAAYLPPAFIHELFHGFPLWPFICVWLAIGYTLILKVVVDFGGKKLFSPAIFSALLFLFLGGSDLVAENVYRILNDIPVNDIFGLHYEWWFQHATGISFQYSSILASLIWVPHQSVAIFLLAGLIVLRADEKFPEAIFFAYGLIALWSPLGMIGMFPVIIGLAWKHRCRLTSERKWMPVAVGLASGLSAAIYLANDLVGSGIEIVGFLKFVPSFENYLIFLIVELGPFLAILRSKVIQDKLILYCFVVLCLIPVFAGSSPDFVMRASLGPIFILAVAASKVVTTEISGLRLTAATIFAVIFILPTGISEVAYHLQNGLSHKYAVIYDPLSAKWMSTFVKTDHVSMREFFDTCGWQYLPQYFSRHPNTALGTD